MFPCTKPESIKRAKERERYNFRERKKGVVFPCLDQPVTDREKRRGTFQATGSGVSSDMAANP
jgi:hypothetical protein